MSYSGPERRTRADGMASDLAEIKTDVKWIVQALPNLATNERVNAVNEKLDAHISSHVSRGGIMATWAGVAVALGIGIASLF